MNVLDPIPDDVYRCIQHICSDLSDRMEIYGLAGTGCESPFFPFLL